MASKAIRGITIEIGGDTTKLGKALADSEKQSRGLQTELKEIEKLLKFDPTNTELLTQKQNVLADTILETSKKLDIMREAEEQVIAQFEKGDIGEDQLRAFQREIMQTEKTLNDLQAELKDATRNLDEFGDNNGVAKEKAEKFEKATKEAKEALEAEKKALQDAEKAQKEHEKAVEDAKKTLEDFGEKAKEAGEKLAVGIGAIGAGVGAGAGYALKLSTDFDKAFNTLQTRTGATAEEMDGLNEAMEGVYKNNFGESIEDVAQSMAIVKTNTKASTDEIQSLTETALLLRDVFDFDVNESTRSAKMLMDQFGISGEEAYNLIAQGAQAGLDKNGDLLDTVNEYSVHYKQLGYTSEEFFNSLINGSASGTFSVDKLGDAMKEFGIRTKDTATTTDEGFQLLGLDADLMREKFAKGGESAREATEKTLEALFSMDDQVKQNQAGVDLFGTMWEDLGIEGVKALMDVSGEASITSEALAKMNEQKYDDIGSALSGLGRTLETDVIDPLGDKLKPAVEDAITYIQENGPEITEVITGIVDKIGEFVSFVLDNGDAILAVIAGIGAGFIAWNVATTIMTVVEAIKAFKIANEGATIAQALFNGVLNANPIVLIVTLIATLVAGIVTFIATNDEARAKFEEIWNKIKEVAGSVLEAIIGFFSSAWETIQPIWAVAVEFFSGLWEDIKAIFSVVAEVLAPYFSAAWDAIKAVWDVVVDYFSTLWENIKTVFSAVKDILLGFFKTAWEAIKAVWDAVVGYFKAIWDSIKGVFSVVKNVLTGNFKGAWEGIKGIVSTWKNYFSGVWESIKGVFGSVGTFFKNSFQTAWNAIKNVFSNWGTFFSGLWDKITSIFSKVGTTISDAISGSVKSAINTVVSGAVGIVNGFIRAINTAISVINAIPGVSIGEISELKAPQLEKGGVLKKGQTGYLEGKGDEWIVPLENHTGWADNIAKRLYEYGDKVHQDTAVLDKLDAIMDRMSKVKQSIVLDTGVLVGETINQIDTGLASSYSLKARGI